MSVNLFDANYYRAANADLANFNDQQAASHFQSIGLNEGRAFSPLVNLNVYRASNSDLAGFNNQQAFSHLQNSGVAEGRRFSQLVDLNFYRNTNNDLAGFNNRQALEHLQLNGINEKRRFSQFVDLNLYRSANNDLSAAGFNNKQLLEHLASYGVAEGRRFSVSLDSNYYRSNNPDLAAAGLNSTQLLEHFEINGLNEGRASSESFNVSYYLANNADLRAAGFNNQQAHQHFELTGFREGRLGAPSGQVSIPKDPGAVLGNAFDLGVLNGDRSVTESIGSSDRDDYYRLTLARTSNFNLSLTGLSTDTNVQLIYDSNANGQVDNFDTLRQAQGGINANASINSALGAGTYFVRVNVSDQITTDTNYNLGVSAIATSPTTPADPGNTLNTALDIGTLSRTSFDDFVGSADGNDYYRFNIATTSNLKLSLKGLSDNANTQLIYDNNGNGQIDSVDSLKVGVGGINNNASISSDLGAGTYFIRVYVPYGSANTNYNLGISATATPPTTPTDPGNTLSTALDIGTLSSRTSFSDFIGSVDRNDFYRFTLTNNSNFNLALNGLKDDARAELISDSNGNGQYEDTERLYSTSGNEFSPGSIITNLAAGNYFVRLNAPASKNTNYTLTLSV